MKEGIHPNYQSTELKCACGESFVTGSTKNKLHIEICAKCHPFFTGRQKISEIGGRVDNFNRKLAKAKGIKA